ncbi:MAG: ComEC/Rec2 family competence protein [Actinobacteria bacterium]|nr:ComEC/Rec2 family competence protein [Actinomycetota bacterium]
MTRSRLLVPPAGGAWLVAVAVPHGPPWVVPVLCAAALVVVAVAVRRWVRQPTLASVMVTVTAAVVAVVSLSVGLHVAVRDAQPWPQLIAQRAGATAELEVVSPARADTGGPIWRSEGTSQRFTAKVLTLRTDEQVWHLRSTVALRADLPPGTRLLRPGDRLAGDFRVGPAYQTHLGHSATLTSVGAPDELQLARSWTVLATQRLRLALPDVAPEQADLVLGMVFGDDSGLSEGTRQAMVDSGLSHLTAVSGANIAIVTGSVLLLARFVGLGSRVALIPAVGAMAVYVYLVGLQPSVIRATVMAGIALAGLVLGGGTGVAALAATVSGVLIVDPWLAASRGFALSCAATAGLILVASPGRELVRRIADRAPARLRMPVTGIVAAALTAGAAGLATTPLVAAYGQGVSLLTVAANVAVLPMVAVVTVTGLLVAVVAWPSPELASLIGVAPAAGAGWILSVGTLVAAVPGGRLPWPSGAWWALGLVAVMLVVALLGRRWRWLPLVAPTTVALGSVVAAVVPGALRTTPGDWQVVICDVGQGDAALLRAGPDSAVLVDAGPTPEAAVECLRRNRVRQVPAVVLSHFHADHVAGLAAVLEQFSPAAILLSPLPEPADTYDSTMAAVARTPGLRTSSPTVGQQLRSGWVTLTVLGPGRAIRAGSAPNNSSLVLAATVSSPAGRSTALLTGDIEPEGQLAVMSATAQLDVDVVKIPHHGSANQHPRFATWAGAASAVASAGADNDYGHPSSLTLATWQATGAMVVRTDEVGDVIAVTGAEGETTLLTRKVDRGP